MDLNTPEMQAKVAELKRQHGDLRLLKAMGRTVVIRRATEAEWEAHVAAVMDPQKRGQAPRTLLERTVVLPERAELDAMLSKLPGLVMAFAGEAGEFNGLGAEVEKKDL